MLQSFIIILREGFESFLLVAVILAYLAQVRTAATGARGLFGHRRGARAQRRPRLPALSNADRQATWLNDISVRRSLGFSGNEALREAVLGVVAIVMVASLVIYMWRPGQN